MPARFSARPLGDPSSRAGSQIELRRTHLRRIVQLLLEHGSLTQAEIARRTGLAPSTVSALVTDLHHREVVTRQDTPGGRRGRQVRLAPATGHVLGIDFGHRHVTVAVADLSRRILARERHELPAGHDHDAGLGLVDRTVDELLAGLGLARRELLSAGMVLPAPITPNGEIAARNVLPGWVDIAVPEEATRRLGLAVIVENDANAGALGEHVWGAGVGVADLVYVKLSDGIGAGLMLDGHLYRGATGSVGELGHTTADPSGPVCRCGNRGCLETVAATSRVLALLTDTHGAELSVQDVVAAALAGDVACRRVLEDTGTSVGLAVAGLCTLVNPALVVLGGELAQAGDLLLDPLRRAVERNGVDSAVRGLRIVTGALGEDSQLHGALALALESAPLPFVTG